MVKKIEGAIAPQESKEKIKIPDVSSHLSLIKEVLWQYGDMSALKVKQSFEVAFERLPNDEQKAITFELKALGLEIVTLDKQNKGVALVRQEEIAGRLMDIFDWSGVVDSAKEEGVERSRQQFSGLAENVVAYLQEYEILAKSVKNKSNNIKQQAQYLLIIVSGIRTELGRLQLADVNNIKPKGELDKEKKSRFPIMTSIGQLDNKLRLTIQSEGLIGFSTLNKLMDKFHSAKKYLEESLLEEETEE